VKGSPGRVFSQMFGRRRTEIGLTVNMPDQTKGSQKSARGGSDPGSCIGCIPQRWRNGGDGTVRDSNVESRLCACRAVVEVDSERRDSEASWAPRTSKPLRKLCGSEYMRVKHWQREKKRVGSRQGKETNHPLLGDIGVYPGR
jgi:hypothetical protein